MSDYFLIHQVKMYVYIDIYIYTHIYKNDKTIPILVKIKKPVFKLSTIA